MKWTRRHRTAAWVVTLVAAALLGLAVRDSGMARYPSHIGPVPSVAVAVAAVAVVALAIVLLRRRRSSSSRRGG